MARMQMSFLSKWLAGSFLCTVLTAVAAGPTPSGVEVLEERAPLYPKAAFEAGESGEVTLDFVIDDRGRVRDVRMTDAEAHAGFAGQAAEALRAWRFGALRDPDRCMPLMLPARQTFVFRIVDGTQPTVTLLPTEFGALPDASGTNNPHGLPLATDAVPVHRAEPGFPRAALRRMQGGTVMTGFVIEVDGSVSDVSVTFSDPAGLFDHEAVRAIERWRFEPHQVDGVAVRAWACQRLDFYVNPDHRAQPPAAQPSSIERNKPVPVPVR